MTSPISRNDEALALARQWLTPGGQMSWDDVMDTCDKLAKALLAASEKHAPVPSVRPTEPDNSPFARLERVHRQRCGTCRGNAETCDRVGSALEEPCIASLARSALSAILPDQPTRQEYVVERPPHEMGALNITGWEKP